MGDSAYDLDLVDFSTCQSFSDLFDYLDVISKSPTTVLTDSSGNKLNINEIAESIYCYVRGSSDPKFKEKKAAKLETWLHDLTRRYGPNENNGLRGTVDRLAKSLTSLEGFPEELAHDLIGESRFLRLLQENNWREINDGEFSEEFEAPLGAKRLDDITSPRAIPSRERR